MKPLCAFSLYSWHHRILVAVFLFVLGSVVLFSPDEKLMCILYLKCLGKSSLFIHGGKRWITLEAVDIQIVWSKVWNMNHVKFMQTSPSFIFYFSFFWEHFPVSSSGLDFVLSCVSFDLAFPRGFIGELVVEFYTFVMSCNIIQENDIYLSFTVIWLLKVEVIYWLKMLMAVQEAHSWKQVFSIFWMRYLMNMIVIVVFFVHAWDACDTGIWLLLQSWVYWWSMFYAWVFHKK